MRSELVRAVWSDGGDAVGRKDGNGGPSPMPAVKH